MTDPAAPPGELESLLPSSIHEYAVFALDAEGRVATWTPAAERITGHPAERVIGSPWVLLRGDGPEAESGAAALLCGAAEGGGADAEGWLRRGDGTEFWGEMAVARIRSPFGNLAGYSVVLRDATERMRAEIELRASHATFEGILAIASDAVVCVDESQRITFFNHGAAVMFGHAAEDVLGEPLEMLIPAPFRAAHAGHIRRFRDSGVTARRMGERGEIVGLRKSGELFPAEASISRLEVAGTRTYTAVLRDISARRAGEAALAQQAAELARSNADLEQFAYVASHDLQEPLRMVASYTQLLARRYGDRLDDDAKEFIGYAVDGVTRMQALINDLLAYSRVGTRGLSPQEVDAGAVLRRALAGLQGAIEESGASVTHGDLPTVRADPAQLVQLFQNLVGNAIKFRGAEPPRVHVSAEAGDEAWVFSVADNGIGIEPEFAERVFVIFQRLHARTRYAGTGIGLSICKKIVERHGGRIWFDSEPGRGTTFHFTLPGRETT